MGSRLCGSFELFPSCLRAGMKESYATNMQLGYSILWDLIQWTEPFIPYVVGQEASLAPTPFLFCLRILGGTYAPDQGPLVLPFCFWKASPLHIVSSLCWQPDWHVSSWPSLHFLHCLKPWSWGHETTHTTYNWISDISVPQSPWPFLPLGGRPRAPFLPTSVYSFLWGGVLPHPTNPCSFLVHNSFAAFV